MKWPKFLLLAVVLHLLVLFGLPHMRFAKAVTPEENSIEVTLAPLPPQLAVLTPPPPEPPPPKLAPAVVILPRDDSPPPGELVANVTGPLGPNAPSNDSASPPNPDPGRNDLPLTDDGMVHAGQPGGGGGPSGVQGGWAGHGHGAQYIGKWNERIYDVVAAPQGVTWQQASAAAQARGGFLAVIDCQEVNDLVFKLADDPSFWRNSPDSQASIGPWINGVDGQNTSVGDWPKYLANGGQIFPDQKTTNWPHFFRWFILGDYQITVTHSGTDPLLENMPRLLHEKWDTEGILAYFNWADGMPVALPKQTSGTFFYARGPGQRQPTWGTQALHNLAYAYVVEYIPKGSLVLDGEASMEPITRTNQSQVALVNPLIYQTSLSKLLPNGKPRPVHINPRDGNFFLYHPHLDSDRGSWLRPYQPDPANPPPKVIEVVPPSEPVAATLRSWRGKTFEVYFAPDGISWYDAAVTAMTLDGHLASIHSADENAFVFHLVDDPKYWRKTDDGRAALGPWLAGEGKGSSGPVDTFADNQPLALQATMLNNACYLWVYLRNEDGSRTATSFMMESWHPQKHPAGARVDIHAETKFDSYTNWAKVPPGGPLPYRPLVSDQTSPTDHVGLNPALAKASGVLFYSVNPDERQPTWGGRFWDTNVNAFVVEWDNVPIRGDQPSSAFAPKPAPPANLAAESVSQAAAIP